MRTATPTHPGRAYMRACLFALTLLGISVLLSTIARSSETPQRETASAEADAAPAPRTRPSLPLPPGSGPIGTDIRGPITLLPAARPFARLRVERRT